MTAAKVLKFLKDVGIETNEINVALMKKLVGKWGMVLSLSAEADFLAGNVNIHEVDEADRNLVTETLDIPDNPDLDGLSLYSGDTESDHAFSLKKTLCELFRGEEPADERYREYLDEKQRDSDDEEEA